MRERRKNEKDLDSFNWPSLSLQNMKVCVYTYTRACVSVSVSASACVCTYINCSRKNMHYTDTRSILWEERGFDWASVAFKQNFLPSQSINSLASVLK